MISLDRNDLLQTMTPDYVPSGYTGLYNFVHNRPIFTYYSIRLMLLDPRITFGLSFIKGPIVSHFRYDVETDRPEVEEFIRQQVDWFWQTSAVRALKALEWGFAGFEAMYKMQNGKIFFKGLKDLEPIDLRVVTKNGEYVGLTVRNTRHEDHNITPIYLGGPKSFWHVHNRERHPWYGLSRLFTAHVPWWEKWSEGGYRDIRRLWFYKNAYEGGTIYHPPGSTRLESGQQVSNKDLARELIEKKRTGGTLTLPNSLAGDSAREWEYSPPSANPVPTGLLEYGDKIDVEELEALGIPPEVIESQSSEGFGSSSGRQMPVLAFFSTLQELANWLLFDFDDQILRFMVALNFGTDVEYQVKPQKIVEVFQEQLQFGTEENTPVPAPKAALPQAIPNKPQNSRPKTPA